MQGWKIARWIEFDAKRPITCNIIDLFVKSMKFSFTFVNEKVKH